MPPVPVPVDWWVVRMWESWLTLNALQENVVIKVGHSVTHDEQGSPTRYYTVRSHGHSVLHGDEINAGKIDMWATFGMSRGQHFQPADAAKKQLRQLRPEWCQCTAKCIKACPIHLITAFWLYRIAIDLTATNLAAANLDQL